LITSKVSSAEESAKIARCKIEGFELMSEFKKPKKNSSEKDTPTKGSQRKVSLVMRATVGQRIFGQSRLRK
jgi:hypothetical protein